MSLEDQLHRHEMVAEWIGPSLGTAQDLVKFRGLFFGDDLIEASVHGEDPVVP